MHAPSAARLLSHDFWRYFLASLAAFVVDIATLSACLRLLHLGLGWSITLGFLTGAATAYALSIRWVFRSRTLAHAPGLEFTSFVAIGVAGLGITQGVLWLGVTSLGFMPELVKLSAAGFTFVFNYALRRALLFALSPRAPVVDGSTA